MEIRKDVDGKTKLYCIIGNPIEHTMSPYLHNTISREYNENSIYIPFKIENEDLYSVINSFSKLSIHGFNVTIPYKNKIIELLDEITDEAKLMGAVNTVKNKDGKLYGSNTDADGFLESFKSELNYDFNGKNVSIFGAGGTSRAITVKLAVEKVKKINIINRTEKKAIDIADIVKNNIKNVVEVIEYNQDKIQKAIEESDVVINTTSLGMSPNIDKTPLNDSIKFSGGKIFYDVIYTPYKTKFLHNGRINNCRTLNGIGMLFYQGIIANEIWNERKIDREFKNELLINFSKILIK